MQVKKIPIDVVGSSTFGRWPKISIAKTLNMFISDEWLVSYGGYKARAQLGAGGKGRGFFRSIRGGFFIAVSGSAVYRLTTNLGVSFLGNINTNVGEVSIAENLSSQIAIADGQDIWIYNYSTGNLTKQTIPFGAYTIRPNYVSYHNSFFLISSNPTSTNPQLWYAATEDTVSPDPDKIIVNANDSFPLQTKSDIAQAVVPIPGRGNNVLVLGTTVAEIWTQVGGTENYRRIQSYNINNGVVSVSTIATSDKFVVWLAQSETNQPVIMVSDGSNIQSISSDGINYLLASLEAPQDSTAIFYRADGHFFYQITFFNLADNLTLFYDFNTQKFFHATDYQQNYHPARQLVQFDGKNYFVSLNNNKVYEMSTDLVTYDDEVSENTTGEIIPQIRQCSTVRMPNSNSFRATNFTFWLAQGLDENYTREDIVCQGQLITEDGLFRIVSENGAVLLSEEGFCSTFGNAPKVLMAMSKNGNQSFSPYVSYNLNRLGKYRNRIQWHRLGRANELTIQLQFYGLQRFVANNGTLTVTA